MVSLADALAAWNITGSNHSNVNVTVRAAVLMDFFMISLFQRIMARLPDCLLREAIHRSYKPHSELLMISSVHPAMPSRRLWDDAIISPYTRLMHGIPNSSHRYNWLHVAGPRARGPGATQM